ncbi:MAG: DUF3618 domain-containing protein [Mycobacteriaceae bacterium]
MPRDTNSIEREIERARDQLANTLDELSVRAHPKRLADDAKASVLATLSKPVVKYSIAGVGVLVAALVVRKILR